MESTLGIIGTITGVLGLALVVFIAIMQVKEQERNAKEHAEEKERHAKELAMYAKEIAMHAQELEMHAQELERQKQEMGIQAQEKTQTECLMFLTDRIFDPDIPKEFKLPFYEEYISMKGNGTAVKFWLLEGEREKKAQQLT
jgi:hypothetical protein